MTVALRWPSGRVNSIWWFQNACGDLASKFKLDLSFVRFKKYIGDCKFVFQPMCSLWYKGRLELLGSGELVHGLPWWLSSRESTSQCRRHGFDPWVGMIPWRRAWPPTPVSLPGEAHGQRSLVGYSPCGHKESDMSETLSTSEKWGFLTITWKRLSTSK